LGNNGSGELAASNLICVRRYDLEVRTTAKIKPEHRSALMAIATRRGQKGISCVLGEAIENFLQGEAEREKRRRTLLSLAGILSKKDGKELRRTITECRGTWR